MQLFFVKKHKNKFMEFKTVLHPTTKHKTI